METGHVVDVILFSLMSTPHIDEVSLCVGLEELSPKSPVESVRGQVFFHFRNDCSGSTRDVLQISHPKTVRNQY